MKRAIELARCTALEDNAGGPFGCVIVKDSEVVAEGANRVIADKDPTCHAEINAIRAACAVLGTHELRGCVLYTTCEPCPMCYGACSGQGWTKSFLLRISMTQKNMVVLTMLQFITKSKDRFKIDRRKGQNYFAKKCWICGRSSTT